MNGRCWICLEESDRKAPGYHPKCLHELFGVRELPRIEVDPSELNLLGARMAGRQSLSGVQRKLGIGWEGTERKTLRVQAGASSFILKPASATFPDLPWNEHLCMRMARSLGLPVARTGVVQLSNGEPALIVRRFDRSEEGAKLPMEDFAQLSWKSPARKYHGSIELCSRLIRRHSDAPPLDQRELFRLVLFAWWIGNDDLHMKNLSLLSSVHDQPRLSPAYDLVASFLYFPHMPFELALPVNGKQRKLRAGDWLSLAERMGLSARIVAAEAKAFFEQRLSLLFQTLQSPLAPDLRLRLAKRLVQESESVLELYLRAKRSSRRNREHPIWNESGLTRTWNDAATALRVAGIEPDGSRLEAQAMSLVVPFRKSARKDQVAGWRLGELVALPRLQNIARVLPIVSKLDGFEKNVRNRLSHLGIYPPDATDELSQHWSSEDIFFECEVAARLAQSDLSTRGNLEVSFADADVLVTDLEGTHIGVECKRVRSPRTKKIRTRVDEGRLQLEKAGLTGFVIVELLQERGTPNAFPNPVASADLASVLAETLAHDLRRRGLTEWSVSPMEESSAAPKSRVFPGPSLQGVIFCKRYLVVTSQPNGRHVLNEHLAWHAVPTVDQADLIEVLLGALRTALPQ